MLNKRDYILPLAAILLLAVLLGPQLLATAAPAPAPAEAPVSAPQASGKTFIDWLVVKHITVQSGGIDMSSALDMQTNIITNIGNAATDFDTSGGLTTAGESTFNGGIDLNAQTIKLDALGTTTIAAATKAIVLMTSSVATGTWAIRTGNLTVGNGSPGTTLNGEDAYIEGTLEVDSKVRLDGALDANSTANVAGAATLNSLVVTTTSDLKGNVSDSGGTFTIADNTMIDGAADAVQLLVQGYSTQTSKVLVVETSAGVDKFSADNSGNTYVTGTLDVDGAVTLNSTLDVDGNISSGTGAVTVSDSMVVTGLANLNGGIAVDTNLFTVGDGTGNLMVAGTSDLKGNVADSAGVFTIADNAIVDGIADAVQLTVQAYLTQTSNLLVLENYTGTDYLYLTGAGVLQQVGAATIGGLLTVNDAAAIAGDADEVQLTVTGHTTQTSSLVVFETKVGTDVVTIANTGAVDIASSSVQFGTDNLYALGYASDARAVVCGVTNITGTKTIASGADTYDYCTCSMGEAPDDGAGQGFISWCTVSGGDLLLYAYTVTGTQSTETNVAVNYCVVSDTQP